MSYIVPMQKPVCQNCYFRVGRYCGIQETDEFITMAAKTCPLINISDDEIVKTKAYEEKIWVNGINVGDEIIANDFSETGVIVISKWKNEAGDYYFSCLIPSDCTVVEIGVRETTDGSLVKKTGRHCEIVTNFIKEIKTWT